MPAADARRVADVYRDTKARITQLLTGPDAGVWASPVPACPGWSVRDVVSHLTAVAQDWADGRLAGAPSDEQTAEHVRRFDSLGENELLKAWSEHTNRLHHLADTTGREPPLGDIACHEHDIRGAIGEPGARDAESVRWTADRLLTILRPPVPLRVVIEGGEYRCGPTGGTEIILRTTRFEALRWRTGRRSRAQLAAMDWSGDPAPVLDHLYLFGPAPADVVE
ncbi:MAG: maleylpyruvate isomerase N-terminal domain-containing protein [Mycobacterium sp.]|nr:maleylpyruvate isomerase N-terminal domain-containing protein [Mycobacterium sp.]